MKNRRIEKEDVAQRERALIESLRAEGFIASSPSRVKPVLHDFKPVPVKGEPLSQTIIEDREPR